jgi:SNF2 family DNA or RNA helicase
MRSKRAAHTNIILADEMGLGKTVQIVSLLASIFEEEGTQSGPFLVVVPLSTLHNWRKELELWAPQLNAIMYVGSKDARKRIRNCEFDPENINKHFFDVLCTSYEVCMTFCTWLCVCGFPCMACYLWLCVYGFVCMALCVLLCVYDSLCMALCYSC